MRYTGSFIISVVGALLIGSQPLYCEFGNFTEDPEEIKIITDRNLYISGEKILFSAFLETSPLTSNDERSLILYCEIITPSGGRICGDKFPISDQMSSGVVTLPEDITTGVYFLRSYTRYMRNSGPYSYTYVPLKIINPIRSEVIQDNNQVDYSSPLEKREIQVEKNDRLEIITDKKVYKTRELVSVTILNTDNTDFLPEKSVISVIPENSLSRNRLEIKPVQENFRTILYDRDTQGPSVTGLIIDNNTGNRIPGVNVNLSILGKKKDFIAQLTDSGGRFRFVLANYYGCHDLFLSTEVQEIENYKVLVDNDFCIEPVRIPAEKFSLTPDEAEIALKMSMNLQVDAYFRKESAEKANDSEGENNFFYDRPSDIIYLGEFIKLPTLEDYFNSIPSLVRVRKRAGEKYFKVYGTQTGLTDFEPLVMVDMVAIGNIGKVLSIPPSSVQRIEVVNSVYVKGDHTYGGLINIITKEGDFGGIDLPESGIFVNYCFLNEKFIDSPYLIKDETPDTRNTLLWIPQISLSEGDSTKLTFNTSDTPGKFLFVLTIFRKNGEMIRNISDFIVEK